MDRMILGTASAAALPSGFYVTKGEVRFTAVVRTEWTHVPS